MELPNYSQLLLQQLYALCREQQFCDCSVLVGTAHFRAHKLVLAAASLLFKSALDGADTISIDSSLVAPDDFALLLEMIYTGRLPLGKHHFSKVISMADSLQMFDVAVSCKTLLRELLSCSSQDQGPLRDSSLQTTNASGENPAPSNQPQTAKLSGEVAAHSGQVSPSSAATTGDPVRVQEQSLCSAVARGEVQDEETMHLASQSQNSELPTSGPSPGGQSVCEKGESTEPSGGEKDLIRGAGGSSKAASQDFLLRSEPLFFKVLSNTPSVLERLAECTEIETSLKETLVACLQGKEEGAAPFQQLLARVQEGQSLHPHDASSLLRLFKGVCPQMEAALLAGEPETYTAGQGKMAAALIQQSREELIQNMTTLEPIQALLDTAEEGFLSETEKQVILACCEGNSPREAVENLIETVVKEKTLKAESLMRLLGALEAPFPGLRPLLDQWGAAAGGTDGRGRWDLEAYGKSLLRRHQATLAKYMADPRLWQQALSAVQHLVPGNQETVEQIAMDATEPGGFNALASAALEKHTLSATAIWQLVLALQEMELPLKPFLAEIRAEPDANLYFQAVGSRDGIATEIILGHGVLISAVLQREAVLEVLPPGETELVKTVEELLSLSLPEEASTTSWRAALSSALDRSLPASQLCDLLCSLQGSCPDLQPVMRELQQAGLLMEGGGEKARQRKVTGASQGEVAAKGEQKARRSPEPVGAAASKKGLTCRACRKSFHFFCRLKVHEKRCRVASQKQVQCRETRASQRELEKQQGGAHGRPGSATATQRQKKKRRLPVACDICGREFAHASGMQYHKLTEHFDEKPFSCEECGAKFAANSTLRNHQRLHSGDRPFVCKHCLAAFSQASALAYHAKRKHAEGKMYACQYCTAVFAQSIELSRHVRTHTGDKPYVCRECGKGFRQANGLSIHLRTFHNIDDPHDCKKCQMSFPTLQEHQQHIHAAHSREYHPCPTCSKVFSAPSLLERHMVTHVGGKPFSCEICNKAYQQLSGLWYHNRTHHPDIFAAQNHRSSKFSSLQCSSCDKTFSSTAAYRTHAKEDHAGVTFYECEKCRGLFPTLTLLQAHMKCRHSGSPPFRCPHCSASFHLQGSLQNHVASEHTPQTERSLGCGLCGELFSGQEQLEEHCSTKHPKVVFADAKVPAAHIVQVIQAPEQVIALAESELAGSQVFLTLPDSQGHPSGRAELVTVTMEDLLNEKVTLICQEAK